MNPEEEVVRVLKDAGADLAATLPCDRVKGLHRLVAQEFDHVPLTREEEGVGIAAGAALAGRHPFMLIQSSGIGNMINALASLTMFYGVPLLLLFSWRGRYKEGIEAQLPMGRYLPLILNSLGVEFVEVERREDIPKIGDMAKAAFEKGAVKAALLSPKVWEGSGLEETRWDESRDDIPKTSFESRGGSAKHTRFEILEGIKDVLLGRIVVSNLGIPSKELYHLAHQPSNFYMLGSMGMATPIGLGIALNTLKEVIVIDGDGSLLMNPGCLATVAQVKPANLTVLAVDNAAHGSTGNQPTATGKGANLEVIARGMGLKNTHQTSTPEEVLDAMCRGRGPRFIHIIANPGNARVPNIPLSPVEIRDGVMKVLKEAKD